MHGWWERMKWRLHHWMKGRQGQDELCQALSILALVMMLHSLFNGVLLILALALQGWSLFRACSRNLEQREQERQAYLRLNAKPREWYSLQKLRWRDRKTHRYFRCTNCKTILRVPRGEGKIKIACPRCRKINIHKT